MGLSRFGEDQEMAGKRDKPEEIVVKLRQVEVLQGQGVAVADAVRQIGVTVQTDYLYGRLSRCKNDLVLAAQIRCKHLSGVSRPKPERPNGVSACARLYSW